MNNEEEFSLAACQKIVDSKGVTPTAYLKAMQYLMAIKNGVAYLGGCPRSYDGVGWPL